MKKNPHKRNKELSILPIRDIIDYVISYVGASTTDWLTVKKQILFSCQNKFRKGLFSRRHETTKKHTINAFEKRIIDYWFKKTGVKLVLDPLKTHDPNWTNHGGRGWVLSNKNKINASIPQNSVAAKHD